MPELIFEGELPTADEFRQSLVEAMAMTNPIDDLLELATRLHDYEQMYQIASADFYQRYQSGTLDDELQHCTDWAATYDLFVKTKRMVEATLMRAAVQPELSETMT